MKSLTITLLIFLPAIASQSSDYCLDQLCSQNILPTPSECQKPTFEEWSACICPHPMWAGVISQCIQECEPQDRGWVQTCPGGSVPRPLVSSITAPTLPPLPASPVSTTLPLQPISISFVVEPTLSSSSTTSTMSIGTFHPLETPTTSQLSKMTGFEPIIADRTVSRRTSVYTLPTLTPTSSPSPDPTSTNSASGSQFGGCVGIGLRFFGPTVAVTGCLAFLVGV